jgi:hypothetical protein
VSGYLARLAARVAPEPAAPVARPPAPAALDVWDDPFERVEATMPEPPRDDAANERPVGETPLVEPPARAPRSAGPPDLLAAPPAVPVPPAAAARPVVADPMAAGQPATPLVVPATPLVVPTAPPSLADQPVPLTPPEPPVVGAAEPPLATEAHDPATDAPAVRPEPALLEPDPLALADAFFARLGPDPSVAPELVRSEAPSPVADPVRPPVRTMPDPVTDRPSPGPAVVIGSLTVEVVSGPAAPASAPAASRSAAPGRGRRPTRSAPRRQPMARFGSGQG